jgi:hypothetical protein
MIGRAPEETRPGSLERVIRVAGVLAFIERLGLGVVFQASAFQETNANRLTDEFPPQGYPGRPGADDTDVRVNYCFLRYGASVYEHDLPTRIGSLPDRRHVVTCRVSRKKRQVDSQQA